MLSTEGVPAGQVSLIYYYTVTLLPLWDMTESNPEMLRDYRCRYRTAT